MPIGKLFHINERCKEVSSREWEQIHKKSASHTGGWYVDFKKFGCGLWKSVKLW